MIRDFAVAVCCCKEMTSALISLEQFAIGDSSVVSVMHVSGFLWLLESEKKRRNLTHKSGAGGPFC